MTATDQNNWTAYCEKELAAATPVLNKHGFSLLEDQPHLKGERFLQQAVSTDSGRKLILLGQDKDGNKVVIKATSDKAGQAELQRERICRQVLNAINFAGEIFHTPAEIAFIKENNLLISIQSFIEQTSTFLERPAKEQFSLALKAFKAQESTHATTYRHRRLIERTYRIRDSRAYLENFSIYAKQIEEVFPNEKSLVMLLKEALGFLQQHQSTIDQYGSFLTHTDFVPHNFRVKKDIIYLLDHSSLTFGNKHEGWARFLNFMTLYNPPLEKAFLEYVKNNRSEEEQLSLKLMRIYRLGEIIWYYTDKLEKCEGNLLKLNTARVHFWKDVLSFIINDRQVPEEIINDYQKTRDSLRSADEKERQRGLH